MLEKIDKSNISAYKYQEKHSELLINACKPIFETLGFTFFEYTKVYYNAKYFTLNTSNEFSKYYFENIKTESFVGCAENIDWENYHQQEAQINIGFSFFPDKPISKSGKALLDFNHWGGITFHRAHIDHCECWHFVLDKNSENKNNILLKYSHIIKDFIIYFNHQFDNIINNNHSEKLAVYNDGLILPDIYHFHEQSKKLRDLQEKISLYNLRIRINGRDLKLSKREVECLNLLANGNNTKEVARILSISPRTVETYIHAIKSKSGLRFKNALIDSWQEINLDPRNLK